MANMLISKYLSPQSSKNQMKPVSLSQCEANATKRRSSCSAEEIEAKRHNASLTRRRKSISSMKPGNMKQEANIEFEKPKIMKTEIMKTDMKPEIKPDSSISEETVKPAAENMTEWRSTSRKSEENKAIYTDIQRPKHPCLLQI